MNRWMDGCSDHESKNDQRLDGSLHPLNGQMNGGGSRFLTTSLHLTDVFRVFMLPRTIIPFQ